MIVTKAILKQRLKKNQVLIEINNIDNVLVDFSGIIEYFKNLKIRHASQGILDDEDIKYLFPDIKESFIPVEPNVNPKAFLIPYVKKLDLT